MEFITDDRGKPITIIIHQEVKRDYIKGPNHFVKYQNTWNTGCVSLREDIRRTDESGKERLFQVGAEHEIGMVRPTINEIIFRGIPHTKVYRMSEYQRLNPDTLQFAGWDRLGYALIPVNTNQKIELIKQLTLGADVMIFAFGDEERMVFFIRPRR